MANRLTGSEVNRGRRPGLLGQLGALAAGVLAAAIALLLGAVLVAALLATGLVLACFFVARRWWRGSPPAGAFHGPREMKTIHRVRRVPPHDRARR